MRQPNKPNPQQNEAVPGNNQVPIKEQLKQRLLDRYDLEEMFKVSRGTIHNWCNKGVLTCIKFGSKKYFDAVEIEELFKKYKQTVVTGKGGKKKK